MQVRGATVADLGQMVEVMFAEPSVELVAFMPTLTGARRFSRELWQLAGLDDFVVADDRGEVVGFAWCSARAPSASDGARAAVAGWGPLGPIWLVARGWARRRVEIPQLEGFTLFELQTHPRRRGTGIGTALLTHVIERTGDRQVSLTTRSDNPARRLYERHEFEVRAEKDHHAFERRTGARGRVLMVRPGATR